MSLQKELRNVQWNRWWIELLFNLPKPSKQKEWPCWWTTEFPKRRFDCANFSARPIFFSFTSNVFQLKTAYSHLDDFCKLPEDTKELYLRDSESGNHGYVRPGQERFDGKTKDIRHAYNICTLNLKLPEEVIALTFMLIREIWCVIWYESLLSKIKIWTFNEYS